MTETMSSLSVEGFVSKSKALLKLERDAEMEETRCLHENISLKELEKRGVCLLKLRIASQRTGMYGRVVVDLQPFWSSNSLLPSHGFTSGDIVGLHLNQNTGVHQSLASGVVASVGQSHIAVAFEDSEDLSELDDSTQYRLIKLANDVTYKRMIMALDDLNSYRSGPANSLINVMFNGYSLQEPISETTDILFYNEDLNECQKEAVTFALCQKDIAIIHGPPGTGKTTTVIEIIKQAVNRKMKVLACAPSNIAVDNLVERLSSGKHKIVRLGHPARLLPTIKKYSLDAIMSASDEAKLVGDVRKDMDQALAKMKTSRKKGEKFKLKEDMKYFRKELRQREAAAIQQILKKADVVLSTLTSVGKTGPIKHLPRDHFDLVIIDEVSQALEAACWIALLRGSRCILAGDHLQLPPTILSHKAAKDGLAVTLMERLLKLHSDDIMRMLTTQYRMNCQIMQWSSDQLYESRLVAHQSVEHHLLRDLPHVQETEDTSIPLLLIDTAGCDLYELCTSEEVSKGNEGEADLVAIHVEALIAAGLHHSDIAVISPYNLQVELIRMRLLSKYQNLEIKSVDGFQGREKEAVIISLVRSNERGEIGFLSEDRRINVAITRAKRHLVVVCDSETINHHPFLQSLVDYMTSHGEVRAAHQYQDSLQIRGTSERPEGLKLKTSTGIEKSGARKKVVLKKRKDTRMDSSQSNTLNQFNQDKRSDQSDQPDSIISQFSQEDFYIQKTIGEFLKTSDKVLRFPNSLTSRERFKVHELCQALGLKHISDGDGKQRHIVVSKIDPKYGENLEKSVLESLRKDVDGNGAIDSGLPVTNGAKDIEDDEKDDIIDVAKDQRYHCSNCGKSIPQDNLQLHQVQCSKGCASNDVEEKRKVNVKKKKIVKSAKLNKKELQTEDDDFDTLIVEATKLNNVCNFISCKTKVVTLGQNCEFCNRRFCFTHHMPEVHGCDDAVKYKARQTVIKDGKLFRGSGVPSKKNDSNKRDLLQKKMDKRLNELSSKRKNKKS